MYIDFPDKSQGVCFDFSDRGYSKEVLTKNTNKHKCLYCGRYTTKEICPSCGAMIEFSKHQRVYNNCKSTNNVRILKNDTWTWVSENEV